MFVTDMAMAAATISIPSLTKALIRFHFPSGNFILRRCRCRCLTMPLSSASSISNCAYSNCSIGTSVKKQKTNNKKCRIGGAGAGTGVSSALALAKAAEPSKLKKRTRSDKEFDAEHVQRYGDGDSHIPVMLGEVLEVFAHSSTLLRSLVDCTVGAAGHASAIIQAYPELQLYIGLDVDPIAHEKAQARIKAISHGNSNCPTSDLKVYTLLKNFKHIKSVLAEVDEKLLNTGVNGILMDLGMSSMQVNNAERGFSVLVDGPLDMRMDPQACDRQV